MIYVLLGGDRLAKEEYMQTRLAGRETVSLYSLDGLQSWYDLVGQSDLFGEQAILVGRDVLDELKGSDLTHLLSHLSQRAGAASSQIVLLLSQENKLSTEAAELLKAAKAQVQVFEPLNQTQLLRWLKSELESHELSMPPQLLAAFSEQLGGNRLAMRRQLEVWQLQGLSAINRDAIEAMPSLNSEASVFGLTEAWAQKDVATAIQWLETLSSQAVGPSQIIGMLGWQAEQLRMGQLCAEDGAAAANTHKSFSSSAKQKGSRLAKRWTGGQLARAIEELIEMDVKIKSGQIDGRVGLELWLWRSSTL